MGLTSDTHLTIETKGDGQMVMVEDAVVKCSRVWMPIVKSQCEANWREVHKKFVDIIRENQNRMTMLDDTKDVEVVTLEDSLDSPVLIV